MKVNKGDKVVVIAGNDKGNGNLPAGMPALQWTG